MDYQTLIAHYKRIIEISQQLTATYDLTTLLRKIVSAAKELLSTEAAAILLLDEASGQLRFAMSTNINVSDMEDIPVPLEGSIAGWIVTHGEPRVIEDVERTSGHFQGVDNRISFQTRNLLGVPMRTHQRVIGVVQAVNKHSNLKFNDEDIVTLQTLASQAAIAIENARLFQQSDFIAEMVHELRTPLSALKASTILLQHPNLPENKRGDVIATMKNETERLIDLTSDFLDIARLESGRISINVTPCEIYPLLAESIEIVMPQANSKHITIHLDDVNPIVRIDRSKTKQVLLNLLTNAIKYNRAEGIISVRLQPIYENDAPFLQITIADTGYGIAKEHQKNMFQKFYRVPTTENIERGTGLGLAICKHIVEAHGGRIWLESEEGEGSQFHVTLPLQYDTTD